MSGNGASPNGNGRRPGDDDEGLAGSSGLPPLPPYRRPRPAPARQGPVRPWWLVAAAVAVGLVTLSIAGTSPPRGIDTVADESWVRAANGVCLEARLRLDELPASGPDSAPAERAAVIRARSEVLAHMHDELRRLRVDGADRAAVERWLDDWAVVVRTGFRVAEAMRAGVPESAERAASEGAAADRRTDAFAAVNGMGDCVL